MEPSINPPGTQHMLLAKTLMMLENRVTNGTGSFFWIAGLSVINSITTLAGSDALTVIGTGLTRIIDSIVRKLAQGAGSTSLPGITALAIVADLAVAALFALPGIFGRKRQGNVVLAGMAVYFMDALILILMRDWLAILFHGFMLISLGAGYQAIGRLKRLEEDIAARGIPVPGLMREPLAIGSSAGGNTRAATLALAALILLVPLGIFLVMIYLSVIPLN